MNEDLIKLFSIPNIVVKIPTIWLLKNSMINESILYNAHLMVRYKTIESYINNKNDWWDTYNRMQRIRVSQKTIIPRNKAENEQTFKDLIDNIKKNGFSDEFPIVINNKFRLIDGSHRLASALFFKIPYVPVTINEATISMDPEYSLNWFKENGFLNIVDDIVNTYKKILMEENND